MEILKIQWIDAKSDDAWQDKEEALARSAKTHLIWSVGAVLQETKDVIVLVRDLAEDETVAGWIAIPKRWVLQRIELKESTENADG